MQLGKRKNDALYGQERRDDLIPLIGGFNTALEVGYVHPLIRKKKIDERKTLDQIVRDSMTGKCLVIHQRYLDHVPRKSPDIENFNYIKLRKLKGRQPMLSDVQGDHIEVWYWVGNETLYCIRTMDVTKWKVGEPDGNYNRLIFAMPSGERITLIKKELGIETGGWAPPGQKILSRINENGIQCTGAKLWKPNELLG